MLRRPFSNRLLLTTLLVTLLPSIDSLAQGPSNIHAPVSALTFSPAVTYPTGGREAAFVAIGDFNHDGKPDLVVANAYVSNTIGILLGNGDGTFQRPVPYPSGGGFPDAIAVLDLNGDGNQDLIVANESRCYPCDEEGSVAIFLGNGDGTFRRAHIYDSGGLGFANSGLGGAFIGVADLNGDGKTDFVIANCASKRRTLCGDGNGILSVFFGNGDGSFQPAVNRNPGIPYPGDGVALADLNGDGKADLVTTTSACPSSSLCATGRVDILLGNGDGTFRPVANYDTGLYFPKSPVIADLNGDGHLDIIVSLSETTDYFNSNGAVSVLLGNGDGTFLPAVNYDTGGALADGSAAADIDGDRHLDIVVANVVGQSVGVLLGIGDGTFAPAQTFLSGGNFTYSVAVRDLNGDGKPDIVAATCAVGASCGGLPGAVGVLLQTNTN